MRKAYFILKTYNPDRGDYCEEIFDTLNDAEITLREYQEFSSITKWKIIQARVVKSHENEKQVANIRF